MLRPSRSQPSKTDQRDKPRASLLYHGTKPIVPNEAPPPEIAVIIPAYNAGASLARAIDSVFAQTYPNFRIYVIDDGSTDNTPEVLASYSNRIVSVRQTNARQGAARNHGIRLSNSPYIAFLDADDEWLPTKLDRQIEVMRQDASIGLIYSDCTTSGTGPHAGSHFARVGVPAGGRVFESFLRSCNVFTPTAMVRRACLDDVGVFNESLAVGEDYNLWLRIAARWQVAVVPDALAIRHSAPASLSATTGSDRVLRSSIASLENILQICTEISPSERNTLRKALADRHNLYASWLLQQGNRAASRTQTFQAMHYGRHDWRVLAKLGASLLPARLISSLRKFRQGRNGTKQLAGSQKEQPSR
jgi:cellulose synthase/poly-beta-1,6-N-acetylglucosamine synthase-like glycosyltransferase